MKKWGIVLTGTLIFLTALWLISIFEAGMQKEDDQMEQKIYQIQRNEENEVTVEVTPISLRFDANLEFKVVLDTHTIELNYDLMKISKITSDQGQSYQPISWNGGSGGHHLSGELIFPAISKNAKSVELEIFNIEEVDRKFKWDF